MKIYFEWSSVHILLFHVSARSNERSWKILWGNVPKFSTQSGVSGGWPQSVTIAKVRRWIACHNLPYRLCVVALIMAAPATRWSTNARGCERRCGLTRLPKNEPYEKQMARRRYNAAQGSSCIILRLHEALIFVSTLFYGVNYFLCHVWEHAYTRMSVTHFEKSCLAPEDYTRCKIRLIKFWKGGRLLMQLFCKKRHEVELYNLSN